MITNMQMTIKKYGLASYLLHMDIAILNVTECIAQPDQLGLIYL